MIPLIIWAVKEIAEDMAEDAAEKVAMNAADAIFKQIDGVTLTDEERQACASVDEVIAATLTKVKETLKATQKDSA
jgi:hypothetical protein